MRRLAALLVAVAAVACVGGPRGSHGETCPAGTVHLGSRCAQVCDTSQECASDYWCDGGVCARAACTSDSSCDQGRVCRESLCVPPANEPPDITAVDGNGLADGADGHAQHHVHDRLVVDGEHLDSAVFQLVGASESYSLASCSAPQENHVELQLANIPPGQYTLFAANAAGSCSAPLELLQGEPGVQGPPGPVAAPGAIVAFAGTTVPTGWLLCDGQAVQRADYADLFAAIGTAYGAGDGSSTFNLPDLRGRLPLGAGAGSGLTSRNPGDVGGSETQVLSTSQMPVHTHTASTGSAGGHSHTYTAPTSSGSLFASSDTGGGVMDRTQQATTGTAGAHTHTVTVDPAGGGQAFEIMNPFSVVSFIIKY